MRSTLFKTGFALILLVFFAFEFKAQSYVRICDSILNLPVHDSVKVRTLDHLASEKFDNDVVANIYYMEQALPLAEKLKKYEFLYFLYNNLGISYKDKGDYARSLDCGLKCLKLAEKSGIKDDILSALMNLGNLYTEKGDDDLGKNCYLRSIGIARENKDSNSVAGLYSNLALFYDNITEKDSVLYYCEKALKIYESQNDLDGIALNCNNIGILYTENNDFEKALYYLDKAKWAYEKEDNEVSVFMVMNNKGDLYYRAGDYQKSFAQYDSALKAFGNSGSFLDFLDAYTGLANTCVKLKRFEEAHMYLKKYADLKDSVYTRENSNKFSELRTGYIKEVNEKEIQLLKTENALKEHRKTTYQVVSIVALLFIIAVSWLFYTRYKTKQKSEIALLIKNKEIEEQHKNIKDSINYAQRIQQAILPTEEEFGSCFRDHFIFFKPKDIVSGDFYWLLPIREAGRKKIILATSDCTGHGVPGGFMSMLGSSLLTEIVNEKKVTDPADILDLLRIKIISALKQKGNAGENQDGMDISICKFDLEENKLTFGAANNSVYLVRDKTLTELKPDKQPIGISHKVSDQFTQHEVALKNNDCIYTFTDGYADQFGGPRARPNDGSVGRGKKFMYKQFEELLIKNAHLPMPEQKRQLQQAFNHWKDDLEQVDDILVIGIRI
ncbi:MAG TPA: tetratricopeptide repeat protein [Bacteroidia bacterium]